MIVWQYQKVRKSRINVIEDVNGEKVIGTVYEKENPKKKPCLELKDQ